MHRHRDPVERLRAIHEITKEAKIVQNILGADTMASWLEYAPPRPFNWFMRTYSRRGLAAKHRPPINLVVSNVPGPRTPLYIAGAKLAALYSVGPILEGIGLERDGVELHRSDELRRDLVHLAAPRGPSDHRRPARVARRAPESRRPRVITDAR